MLVLSPQSQSPATAVGHPTTTDLLRVKNSENFPVALRILPAEYRRDLMAIYAFARFVDYVGDEAQGDRVTLLGKVSRDLDRLYRGHHPTDPVLRMLAPTVAARSLPREPFDDLIAANVADQRVHDYASYADLLGYCALSANPVGRLVLHVFGHVSPENEKLSDKVCTALQILEHLQDVAEDAHVGRVYLPAQDREAFGVTVEDLTAPGAGRPLRALVAFETQRAVRLLDEGGALVGNVTGAARLAIAGFVAGGQSTAAAIAAARFDTLAQAAKPGKATTAALAVRALLGARR